MKSSVADVHDLSATELGMPNPVELIASAGREFSDMFVDWFEEGSSRGKHPLVSATTPIRMCSANR